MPMNIKSSSYFCDRDCFKLVKNIFQKGINNSNTIQDWYKESKTTWWRIKLNIHWIKREIVFTFLRFKTLNLPLVNRIPCTQINKNKMIKLIHISSLSGSGTKIPLFEIKPILSKIYFYNCLFYLIIDFYRWENAMKQHNL